MRLSSWVDMLGSLQMATRSDGAGCDAGCRCSERRKKSRIRNHWRHPRQVIMLVIWPRRQWDWWVAWSGHSRMSLSSIAKCRNHQNRRPLLGCC